MAPLHCPSRDLRPTVFAGAGVAIGMPSLAHTAMGPSLSAFDTPGALHLRDYTTLGVG